MMSAETQRFEFCPAKQYVHALRSHFGHRPLLVLVTSEFKFQLYRGMILALTLSIPATIIILMIMIIIVNNQLAFWTTTMFLYSSKIEKILRLVQ